MEKDTEKVHVKKVFGDTVLAERPHHQCAFSIIGGSTIGKDVFRLVGFFTGSCLAFSSNCCVFFGWISNIILTSEFMFCLSSLH